MRLCSTSQKATCLSSPLVYSLAALEDAVYPRAAGVTTIVVADAVHAVFSTCLGRRSGKKNGQYQDESDEEELHWGHLISPMQEVTGSYRNTA